MPRHRGKFDPTRSEPYELSRSRIEEFVKCPACFYMKQVEKIDFPSIPAFLLNEATDVLLKKHFDKYRQTQECPPYLIEQGYDHLVPFQHDNFQLWTQSVHYGAAGRMHTVVEDYNLKIGGGLDDVWQDTKTGALHIVDYKSTSKEHVDGPELLETFYAEAYKRQMDLYVWVMRSMGFEVSNTGYFLYVNGDRATETDFLHSDKALMEFKVSLIPYETNLEWIDRTLAAIKETLHLPERPEHSEGCEHGKFLKDAG